MIHATRIAFAGLTLLTLALAGCQSADTHTFRKCTLLIPLAYNDGTAIPPTVLTSLQNRLFERFGGYTRAGTAEGTYRMADGSRADDRTLVLWVAVPPQRVPELRREVAGFARDLRQESMYFEVSDATVEFIAPTPLKEQRPSAAAVPAPAAPAAPERRPDGSSAPSSVP
jgi:hypothetical protein